MFKLSQLSDEEVDALLWLCTGILPTTKVAELGADTKGAARRAAHKLYTYRMKANPQRLQLLSEDLDNVLSVATRNAYPLRLLSDHAIAFAGAHLGHHGHGIVGGQPSRSHEVETVAPSSSAMSPKTRDAAIVPSEHSAPEKPLPVEVESDEGESEQKQRDQPSTVDTASKGPSWALPSLKGAARLQNMKQKQSMSLGHDKNVPRDFLALPLEEPTMSPEIRDAASRLLAVIGEQSGSPGKGAGAATLERQLADDIGAA